MTDEDIPTTWDELATVSQTLTTGDQTGLVFTGEADRVGAFMVQAGGWFTNEDQTEATANTPENEEALTYLQENLIAGNFQHAADVEAGWGGEAFGTAKGAMTVEGPWIVGALEADYPDVMGCRRAARRAGRQGHADVLQLLGRRRRRRHRGRRRAGQALHVARGAAGVHRGVRREPVAQSASRSGTPRRSRRRRRSTPVSPTPRHRRRCPASPR